jgi:ParB family chromosome partitioning protein
MEDIDILIESIRARGQVQPALVRPVVGNAEYEYELVSGERRWRACTRLGRPLRVVVLPIHGSEEQYALSCAANSQQELTPMEICNSLWILYNSKEMQHVKRERRMAATAHRYFGRGHQWAWSYTGLARLDERLQPLVRRSCPLGEYIPVKIAARLAGLPKDVPDIQVDVWREIVSADPPLSVQQAQQLITKTKKRWAAKGKRSRGRPLTRMSITFNAYLDRTVKEMEPILELTGEKEFEHQLRTCDPNIRRNMVGTLDGIIERMQMMRDLLRGMDRSKCERIGVTSVSS